MYQEQRLEEIIKLLEDRGSLSAKEMVDYFQVSKDTIRRDFSILAKEKRAKRTHGGLLPIQKQRILGFQGRAEQSSKEKEKIAHLATQLISESQLIFYDVSTTVLELAKITDKKVTIFSHSLDNALILGNKPLSKYGFMLTGFKQGIKSTNSSGELEVVNCSLTLKEYIPKLDRLLLPATNNLTTENRRNNSNGKNKKKNKKVLKKKSKKNVYSKDKNEKKWLHGLIEDDLRGY